MNRAEQYKKAIRFKELHEDGLFLLPNAWNGGSAVVCEKSGFDAIGTTSAGIAFAMGRPDGELIAFSDLVRVAEEILSVVNLPVSIDIERGYAESIDEICRNVETVIDLGAVGINIEDGIPSENAVEPLDSFTKKTAAVSKLRAEMEIPFFINARTDIYLLRVGRPEQQFAAVVERAAMLKNAGADCIFIPGPLGEKAIIALRSAIDLPINLFIHPAFNDCDALSRIGINRLSSGSAPVRAAYSNIINIMSDFQNEDCSRMLNHDFTYAAANKYF